MLTHACEALAFYAQVECHPAGPVIVRIQGYRATAGGFVSMTFGDVAGSGTFTAVDLRTSLQVGCSSVCWRWHMLQCAHQCVARRG